MILNIDSETLTLWDGEEIVTFSSSPKFLAKFPELSIESNRSAIESIIVESVYNLLAAEDKHDFNFGRAVTTAQERYKRDGTRKQKVPRPDCG